MYRPYLIRVDTEGGLSRLQSVAEDGATHSDDICHAVGAGRCVHIAYLLGRFEGLRRISQCFLSFLCYEFYNGYYGEGWYETIKENRT